MGMEKVKAFLEPQKSSSLIIRQPLLLLCALSIAVSEVLARRGLKGEPRAQLKCSCLLPVPRILGPKALLVSQTGLRSPPNFFLCYTDHALSTLNSEAASSSRALAAGGAIGVLPCHLDTKLLSEGSFRVGLLTSLLSSDPWKVICSKQKTHRKGWSSVRDAQLQRVGTSLCKELVSH